MQNNQLTNKARAVARCLSYSEDTNQASAKHLLLEMAHKLDAQDIRVHKKKDGILFVNASGNSRFATFKETVLYKLFGVIPKCI